MAPQQKGAAAKEKETETEKDKENKKQVDETTNTPDGINTSQVSHHVQVSFTKSIWMTDSERSLHPTKYIDL